MPSLLPPLPRLGAVDTRFRPAGPSLPAILTEQHAQLRELVARQRREPARRELASVLVAVACRHLCAEEQYLYPAVRAALPDGPALAGRELAAARSLRELLRGELLRAAAEPDALARAVDTHCRRAERELFPALERALDEVALIRLGNRVQIAVEAAPSRPHLATPVWPPWNKWTDPLVGAVDKVRDALCGRVTYLEDL